MQTHNSRMLLSTQGTYILTIAGILVGLVLAFNLHLALVHRIDVPFVDGWPVLNRIMLLYQGGITRDRFLFSPHGAHLHSLIYAVAFLDFRYLGGQQELQSVFSLLAIGVYAALIVLLLAWEGLRNRRALPEIVLVAIAAVSLLSGLSDWETTLIPFQMVLTASRLIYFVLLWLLIIGLVRQRPLLYGVAMLMALPATTFHGAGYLFAVCIIVLHMVVRSGWPRLALSFLPLLCLFAVQSHYSMGGGELSNLGQVLRPSAVGELLRAFAEYFASPFFAFLGVVDRRLMIAAGALMACSTTVLTLLALRSILGIGSWTPTVWWHQLRYPEAPTGAARPALVFFFLVGIMLLLSGSAAAALWVIRIQALNMPSGEEVLGAFRYAAYANLACLMPLAVWLYVRPRGVLMSVVSVGMPVWAMLILVFGFFGTYRTMAHPLRQMTEVALAGLSVGLPPTLPETEIVWPGARLDWLWKTEFPHTVEWLMNVRRGPWRDLPALHARGGPSYAAYPLAEIVRTPMRADSSPGWCKLSARVPSWGRDLPAPGTVIPVSGSDGIVVGFAAMSPIGPSRAYRGLQGFVGCSPSDASVLYAPRDERG